LNGSSVESQKTGAAPAAAPDRRQQILQEAGRLFATNGYDGTPMRDIAAASGILPGSLYHHFSSKEQIFLAVHEAGVAFLIGRLTAALEGIVDPRLAFETALVAHCEAILDPQQSITHYPAHLIKTLPAPLRDTVIAGRDAYEQILAALIEKLPLDPGINHSIFRLHVLGALNWVPNWFKPGITFTPAEVGQQLALICLQCC
jgi:AcrR family transcriptional regulator